MDWHSGRFCIWLFAEPRHIKCCGSWHPRTSLTVAKPSFHFVLQRILLPHTYIQMASLVIFVMKNIMIGMTSNRVDQEKLQAPVGSTSWYKEFRVTSLPVTVMIRDIIYYRKLSNCVYWLALYVYMWTTDRVLALASSRLALQNVRYHYLGHVTSLLSKPSVHQLPDPWIFAKNASTSFCSNVFFGNPLTWLP